MNISEINVTKALKAYLQTAATALGYVKLYNLGPPLIDNIFTGPNEQRNNKEKQYIVISFESYPENVYLGDGQMKLAITYTLELGWRDDVVSVAGTQKELKDLYVYDILRSLRSREFRVYMATRGVKVAPDPVPRAWDEKFSQSQELLRKSFITLKLISHIETLETTP